MSRSSGELLEELLQLERERLAGPGPEERKLRNRLLFWLTGHWPQSVVRERVLRDRLRSTL